MDDSLRVRGLACLCNLARDGQRLVERQAAPGDALRQRLAFDQLEHERTNRRLSRSRRRSGFLEAVDDGDIGMIEGGERLCLALEAGDGIGICRRELGKNLDRDVAIQPAVARPVDVAHPTGANRRENLVRSDPGARQKGHKEPARLYPPRHCATLGCVAYPRPPCYSQSIWRHDA